MEEVVTMNHPDPRIIRHKPDHVGHVRRNKDSIQTNWTARERLSIARQHGKGMPMQVNWMVKVTLILQLNLHQLPILDHKHPCIRKDLAIDRIGHAFTSKGGPHLVIEVEGVRYVKTALWRDWGRRRLTIGGHIEPLRYEWKRRWDCSLTEHDSRGMLIVLLIRAIG